MFCYPNPTRTSCQKHWVVIISDYHLPRERSTRDQFFYFYSAKAADDASHVCNDEILVAAVVPTPSMMQNVRRGNKIFAQSMIYGFTEIRSIQDIIEVLINCCPKHDLSFFCLLSEPMMSKLISTIILISESFYTCCQQSLPD